MILLTYSPWYIVTHPQFNLGKRSFTLETTQYGCCWLLTNFLFETSSLLRISETTFLINLHTQRAARGHLYDFPILLNTYIYKLTLFSHECRQKLQNAICYDPYILISPRSHPYIWSFIHYSGCEYYAPDHSGVMNKVHLYISLNLSKRTIGLYHWNWEQQRRSLA